MSKRVTVRVPDDLFARVDARVDDGEFDSRSAAIRSGLRTLVESADEQLCVDGGHHHDQPEGSE